MTLWVREQNRLVREKKEANRIELIYDVAIECTPLGDEKTNELSGARQGMEYQAESQPDDGIGAYFSFFLCTVNDVSRLLLK